VSKNRTNSTSEIRAFAPKKTYRRPKLTEYGHVAKLTAGTTGSFGDKGSLSNQHGQG
jgi:hypothetical protein